MDHIWHSLNSLGVVNKICLSILITTNTDPSPSVRVNLSISISCAVVFWISCSLLVDVVDNINQTCCFPASLPLCELHIPVLKWSDPSVDTAQHKTRQWYSRAPLSFIQRNEKVVLGLILRSDESKWIDQQGAYKWRNETLKTEMQHDFGFITRCGVSEQTTLPR